MSPQKTAGSKFPYMTFEGDGEFKAEQDQVQIFYLLTQCIFHHSTQFPETQLHVQGEMPVCAGCNLCDLRHRGCL